MEKAVVPKGTERILFVDDETGLVDMADRIITSLGYDVTCRTNSLEALDLLLREEEVKLNEFILVIAISLIDFSKSLDS